jgi:DNA-binding NarL/FixJ family response regulator
VEHAPPRNILLVTDDTNTDSQLRAAFTEAAPEWKIQGARSRQEIEAAARAKLVLLDLMLSREAAFEVLRWLRRETHYRAVPVFVLGSDIVKHVVDEAYSLGANACLLKESQPHGLPQIARAIAAYAALLGSPGCTGVARN